MYKISYSKQALKDFRKLPRSTAVLIRAKIMDLAVDPYRPGLDVKKLHGRKGYRLRVVDWRVLYKIVNEEITILVLKIAQRDEVYR